MKLCIVVGATLALACSVVAGPVDEAEAAYRKALQKLNIQYKLKLYELKGDYPGGSREAGKIDSQLARLSGTKTEEGPAQIKLAGKYLVRMDRTDEDRQETFDVEFQSANTVKLNREGLNDWVLTGKNISLTDAGLTLRFGKEGKLLLLKNGDAVQNGSTWINVGKWIKLDR